jgi:hypothetical protein
MYTRLGFNQKRSDIMNFSLRTMLLGISLILLGIYMQSNSDNDFYGNDFIIVITGFIFVIIGYFKNFIKKIIDK